MRTRSKSRVILLMGFAALLGPGAALDASPGADDRKLPELELRDLKLDNGLRVILVPDHSAPVYASPRQFLAQQKPDSPSIPVR
jgi:hypothetical protein